MKEPMQLTILHLYPDLLNLYGDKGNIACLCKRLLWRGISVKVKTCTINDPLIDLSDTDIIFIGGGSDREQKIVCESLLKKKDLLKHYVRDNGVLLAVCGGYQLLGKYYQLENERIQGLGILNITTEAGHDRLIGNIALETSFLNHNIVGFENHGGRTQIGRHKPLGKVIKGHGNTGKSGAEGVLYKNVVATYLHGPLLPKNPELCDYLLTAALKRKYPKFKKLTLLDDQLELQANTAVYEKIIKK